MSGQGDRGTGDTPWHEPVAGGRREPVIPTDATSRLKTARGQLRGIERMVVGGDCREAMRQLAAVAGLVEAARRSVLRSQLEALVRSTTDNQGQGCRDLLGLLGFAFRPQRQDPERRSTARADRNHASSSAVEYPIPVDCCEHRRDKGGE